MNGLWAAVRFLTRLPAPDPGPQPPGRQAPWFPLAGALAGAVSAAAAAMAGLLWPGPVQAAAAVAASLWITGGLHVDGWMDLADGLGSHLPPEEARRVMRDSRVGAVGALAGALAVVIRFALVVALPAPWRWRALIAAAASSRAGMVWAAARGPAPEGEGLGAAFVAGVGWKAAAWAVALALAIALLVAGPAGALSLVAAIAVAEVLRARTAGLGLTGDTLGAMAEVGEWAALALLAAHLPA